MAKITLNGKIFNTALLCTNNHDCVAIRQEGNNILIADTKDSSIAPLTINIQHWESFKAEIKAGKFDVINLSEEPLDIAYHGISIRKIHSHILVCDTINDKQHSLAFTLKEWNMFTQGQKEDDFDSLMLLATV